MFWKIRYQVIDSYTTSPVKTQLVETENMLDAIFAIQQLEEVFDYSEKSINWISITHAFPEVLKPTVRAKLIER